ncbi:Bis(5'-nucleosyl)-tetraphosphatase PrpE [asymmetrical] [Roseivivax jejudonensis]|uniref:Bis(5'-nucleosyl)-tetraphosphatase PrpE [asymmetrical] n=1 Tax=Roseivivax jejudonensis TaxID=1529041 RepID=A0A1X6ZRY9_9RHOB|nr:metallophosphoesterase [Roseivivax jejudonensis]SLN59793.1 Bis(5'-nucleosyl)-tetraphosphatase PrpE [asymmetrical] [Roseivivax jejudonensis]
MSFLRRTLGLSRFDAQIAPRAAFAAIGDLHGCWTETDRLLRRLDGVLPTTASVVFVGDYIDRGPESGRVLRNLMDLQRACGTDRIVCLSGNHEEMLLDMLDAPADAGPRWLRHGGLETLASLGVAPVPLDAEEAAWFDLRDAVRAALGPKTEAWLRALPTLWHSGNVAVTHAGADPALPLDAQDDDVLRWGHRDFARRGRRDGMWVVHGHTIVDTPKAAHGRIAIDTGAYATGTLTAAVISRGSCEFLFA